MEESKAGEVPSSESIVPPRRCGSVRLTVIVTLDVDYIGRDGELTLSDARHAAKRAIRMGVRSLGTGTTRAARRRSEHPYPDLFIGVTDIS